MHGASWCRYARIAHRLIQGFGLLKSLRLQFRAYQWPCLWILGVVETLRTNLEEIWDQRRFCRWSGVDATHEYDKLYGWSWFGRVW